MNKKLILAEHICKSIKDVRPTKTAAFKNVVDEYNKLVSMVNDEKEMPSESPFDREKDVKIVGLGIWFTTEGNEKIERIKTKCELYIASCQGKNRMKKIIVGIITFLFSGIGLFFLQQCNGSDKKDAAEVNAPINLKNDSSYQPQQNINIINGNNNTITNSNNSKMEH